MRHAFVWVVMLAAMIATGCARGTGRTPSVDERYERIRAASVEHGPGGLEVLSVAHQVLSAPGSAERCPDVGLEDLWAHALKEGRGLFDKPDRLWGATPAGETLDLIGQTTIGPWQITIANARYNLGPAHGIDPKWSDAEVYAYCREHRDVQAKMIADYIQTGYRDLGRRTPYAIQRYFWLEAYVRGWIGRGPWDSSVLAQPPNGDWKLLTPEMKANTGFYAKQIVCGSRSNPQGLLYWLWISGDHAAVRDVLRAWRDQRAATWDEKTKGGMVFTDEHGAFAIRAEDLRYIKDEKLGAAIAREAEAVMADKAR